MIVFDNTEYIRINLNANSRVRSCQSISTFCILNSYFKRRGVHFRASNCLRVFSNSEASNFSSGNAVRYSRTSILVGRVSVA